MLDKCYMTLMPVIAWSTSKQIFMNIFNYNHWLILLWILAMDDAAHVKCMLNHATVTPLPGCMTPPDLV